MLSLKILLSHLLQLGLVLLLVSIWFVALVLIVSSVQDWLGMVGAVAILVTLLMIVAHGCYNLAENLDGNRRDWKYEKARLDFIAKRAERARQAIDICAGQRGCTDYIDLRSGE